MIVLAIIAALAAVGLGIGSVFQRRVSIGAAASEDLTIDDLAQQISAAAQAIGPGSFAKRVAISGELVATGPLLTSPFTGTPCLWHRTVIRRRYLDQTAANSGTSQANTPKTTVDHDVSSEQVFGVTDGRTVLVIDPRGAVVDDPQCTQDAYEPVARAGGASVTIGMVHFGPDTSRNTETLGLQRVEYVLLPGAQRQVIGQVTDRNGTAAFAKSDGERLTLSTRTKGDLVRAGATSAKWLAIGAVIALAVAVGALVAFFMR